MSDLPTIPNKRYFTIGEVGDLCGVKPHVLRYWEQEFDQLKPIKRRGNRRNYQHHEVEMVRRIRELLYEHGYTISGARNQLQQHQSLLSQPAIGDLQSFTFTPTTMALAIDRDAEPSRASEASSGSPLSGHSADTANNTPTDWDSISRLRRELQAISQLLIA